jgi:alpha-tubulin suppressor-like RCC1 family protein
MKKTSVSTLAILTALLFAAFPPAPLEAQAWAYVSAGVAHGAAIATDGSLWTWGNNNSGQLGIGTSGWDTDTNIPVRVGTDTNWALVSVGATHTVAVRTDGSLWAWGSNWRGQLGIGTSGRGTDTNTPVRVGTDTNWASVSAGWEYTMAIRTDGSLWAWGDNNWWRLGIGTSGNPHTPTRVGSETDWASVSAGWDHTAAVKTDGTLWTWGRNDRGQLGIGTSGEERTVPTRVGTGANWASVSAGPSGEHPFANGVVYLTGSHTAAVTTTGELWVWGTNTWGQLGDGTGGTSNFHTSPIRIGADSNWASVSVGWNRTAAIKTDGTLWLWRGRPGNLNFNEETWSYTTAPDAVWERPEQEGTETWSFVSVSRNSTMAIRADGTLWLWGSRFVWDPDLGWDANGEQITP